MPPVSALSGPRDPRPVLTWVSRFPASQQGPSAPALKEAAQLAEKASPSQVHFVADLELQGQVLRGNSIHTHLLGGPWILPPLEACASREISCVRFPSKKFFLKKSLLQELRFPFKFTFWSFKIFHFCVVQSYRLALAFK